MERDVKIMIANTDYCVRATAANGQIRAFVADTRFLVNTAASIHKTSAVASAALGRTLTAAAIMGIMTGNDSDFITIHIKGDGPIGGVMAVSKGTGTVKGYVNNPEVDIIDHPNGKLNVAGIVGKGSLTVTKDLGLKEPYSGSLDLVSGEIAQDLANYFLVSEQVPTALSLGVLVDKDLSIKRAGGFLIQLMPFATDEVVQTLEEKLSDFPNITTLLESGKQATNIMDMLLSNFGYEILQSQPLSYQCDCSKQRCEKVLISIGADELQKIIEEDGKACISCHFCKNNYIFDEQELHLLINSLGE